MLENEFLEIQNRMEDNEHKIMGTKGVEYTQGDLKTNRLANFYRIAEELNQDPKVICYVYLKKHLDSIACYVKNSTEYTDEGIEGRINDARNYLILLNAIICEQKKAGTLRQEELG
jgi:hypothetical protein